MKVTVKILLAAGLTVLLAEAAAAELVERRLEAPRDAIISVQNTAGAIDIRGWSRNEVEVRGDLGRDVEELVLERDDREIRIEVRASRRNNRRISSDLDIRVPEGSTVRLVLENVDPALVHDFVIEDLGIDSGKVAAGEKTIVEFVAERAGSFRIICTEPGHEAGGMVGTFTVN